MLSAKYIHVSKISQCMSCIINFYSTLYTRIQLLCCMSPMPWLSGKRISQMVLGSNPSWSLNLASFATSCIHIEMIQYVMCSIHRRIWHCVQGTSDTMARTPQTCGCEDLERYNTLYLLSDSSLCMWNYIQVSQRQAWCRPVSPPHFTESMILIMQPRFDSTLSLPRLQYLYMSNCESDWAEPSMSHIRKCCISQFMICYCLGYSWHISTL